MITNRKDDSELIFASIFCIYMHYDAKYACIVCIEVVELLYSYTS